MTDDERYVRENLLATAPAWEERAAVLHAEVTSMYEAKRKRAATLSWAGTGLGVFLLLLGVAAIVAGVWLENLLCVVLGAMMFLFGDGWITGRKLLYWTWNSRIQVERDIKELHADVLEIAKRIDTIERMSNSKTTAPAS